MPYAVELYFDRTTEATLCRAWQTIAEAGFRSPILDGNSRPHVSLAVYDSDTLDIDSLQKDLTTYAETVSPFELALSNIGIFPTAEGVIFLGITVTYELLEVHANFHHAFHQYAQHLRAYYRVGNWVPHCTLASGVSAQEAKKIVPVSWKISLPIYGRAQEIGLAKASPTGCEFLLLCDLSTS